MGTEVFYCSRCQIRLFGHQFLEGTAVRVQDLVSCASCLGDLIAPLPLREQEEILLRVQQLREGGAPGSEAEPGDDFFELDDSAAAPEADAGNEDFFELDTPEKRKRSSSSTGLRPVVPNTEPASTGQTVGLLFFIGAVVLLGVLGSMVYFFGSKPQPLPPGTAVRPVPAPRAPETPGAEPAVRRYGNASKPVTREDLARELLDKAREFVKDNPRDLSGQQEQLKKALAAAEGTAHLADVQKEFATLRERQKELIGLELEPLDKEVKAAVAKEEFKRANDLLEEARKKHPLTEWSLAIDTRIRDVGVAAWKVFAPLRDAAVAAKARKADGEVKTSQERVARWGLASFIRELDRSLAAEPGSAVAAPPPPAAPADAPPLTPEGRAYQGKWALAMDLAAQRDYDAAVTQLNRAAQDASEEAVKKEIEADLSIVRQVQAVHRDALQIVAAWPRGERITLEFLDDNLQPSRLVEPFLRADAEYAEVSVGGAAHPVELAEITARSLAHLYRARAGAKASSDARPAAALCLMEGDVDAARANLAGPADQLPWKYWSLGSRIQESRSGSSDAARHEAAARKLYFSAEREHRDLKLRAGAIQSYRQLLNEYADAAIVKRRRAHIAGRRDGAKDWVFLADDLDARGTFKAAKNAKVGACFTSTADTADAIKSAGNFAELRFYAFPETAYRCWFYVGGCCNEVFSCFYQASGATYLNPETKELLSAEPAGSVALPVKHSITFLKKNHEDHSGPKEPKRWEWIEVKLPKYAQAGIKAARLITDQKGFSVAHAVVSSTRSGPPGDAELKSWLKKAEPDEPPPAAVPNVTAAPAAPAGPPDVRDASLVGHWAFDEGARTALDGSGKDNTGILTNDPLRGAGKYGQALVLDGKDRYVNLPNAAALDGLQEGSYSISCWFKPHGKPAGQGDANDAAYALVVKSSLHEGLTYSNDGRFIMDHWLSNNTATGATSAQSFSPGAFHHVAGVVNRSTGTVQIFVDGRLESAVAYAAGAAARDFGKETWKVGIAAPGAATLKLSADGTIDEVRLYARALTPQEVRILAGAVTAPVAPTIAISSPAAGEQVDPGASVAITTQVSAPERIAKVEFLAGATLIGTDSSAPFGVTWAKVPAGNHTLIARLTTKEGTVISSAPVTLKAGSLMFFRAFNLGGPAVSADGISFEGKTAKGLTSNGIALDIKAPTFTPAPEGARAALLRTALVHTQGTSVSVIGIPNAQYQIYLTVVEDASPQTFDLLAEARVMHAKYKSGSAGTWARLGPWTVDVTDGLLDVEAKGGAANFAALEIWKVAK